MLIFALTVFIVLVLIALFYLHQLSLKMRELEEEIDKTLEKIKAWNHE